MLIKICGMCEPGNVKEVAALQPDMIGFIFYPCSPRYVGDVAPEKILCPGVKKVGVFVNESAERVLELAGRYGLDMIQLHGGESPEYCYLIREKGLQVMKAVGVEKTIDLQEVLVYEPVCDMLLFDARSSFYGGTGRCFDWGLLDTYKGHTPFLLSGGISFGHAQQLKQLAHPCFAGVDVNSCFEVAPGMKNTELLARFLQILRF